MLSLTGRAGTRRKERRTRLRYPAGRASLTVCFSGRAKHDATSPSMRSPYTTSEPLPENQL